MIAEDDMKGGGRQIEVVGTGADSGVRGDHDIRPRCIYGLYVAESFTSREKQVGQHNVICRRHMARSTDRWYSRFLTLAKFRQFHSRLKHEVVISTAEYQDYVWTGRSIEMGIRR